MMTHDHCSHALRLCATCDVVYCATCKKEWGGHAHHSYPYYWPQGQITYPWTTTYGDTTGGSHSVTPLVSAHEHG